ncbi:MAG: hypothetical protein ACRCXZ_04735 [Patescibacteria group bacterium]
MKNKYFMIMIALIALTISVVSIQAKYQDTAQYINFNGYKYIKVGTGNLGNKKEYGLFNKPEILDTWIESAIANPFDLKENLKNKLNVIDLIQGVTEGNIVFNKNTNKWILSENFVAHYEPIGSGRTKDNLGTINTGLISAACYINRPVDTELNPLCDQVFKQAGINEDTFGVMSFDEKKQFLYKSKLPLLLTNYKTTQIKKDALKLLDMANQLGLSDQKTTIKLYYIDQINQLGFPGAQTLLKLESKYKSFSKPQLIQMLKSIGVIDENGIFRIAWGDTFDFNSLPREVLRLLFSRLMWYNLDENETSFKGRNIDWIERAAKQETYNSLLRGDYPNSYNEIKEAVRNSKGEQNWSTMLVEGEKGPNNTIIVKAYTTKKEFLYETAYPIKKTGFVYTPQNILTGDAFRRYSVFPQSNKEFVNMNNDSKRIIKEIENLF